MKDDKPLVSVISGYYNRENLVDESIQSLIDQTYQNLEIIIFDDCSTDNTYEKLKRFETDERVTIIRHEQNIGFVRGLINTIKKSKGEYIAIHGSGDYSYPTRIEKQVDILSSNKKISTVTCENELCKNNKIISVTKKYPSGKYYSDLLKKNKISGGDVMFKKNFYDKVGGYRVFFRYAQDFDLWCRMSLISDYYILPEVLYKKKFDASGGVSTTPEKRIKQIFYYGMAVQSIKTRKSYGYDYIDLMGFESFSVLKKNKRVSQKLSSYAIKLFIEGNNSEFQKLLKILKTQKKTFRYIIVLLINNNIVSKKNINLLIILFKKIKYNAYKI